ncbi:MAG: adenylate/guanylate cyclase domain-containing protein [Dehalococcoidia bacterium]
MQQQVQFVTSKDGVSLAVATMGAGLPLVIVPGWISHLELDWTWPDQHDVYERLAENHLLVRYDKRGTGLSDRNIEDFSLEANVADLEAIVQALGLTKPALLGYSQGGTISIGYTARHPENVSHLIIYGSFHDGRAAHFKTLVDGFSALIRADWGGYGASAMLEVFIPGAPPQAREVFAEYQRQAANAEDAEATLRSAFEYEVTPLLEQINVPTLVLHRRGDKACPFQQGREIASRIRGARFVPLEGDVHVMSLGDTEPLIEAIEAFLLGEEGARHAGKASEGLQTILFTDIEGSTALTQRLGDEKAQQVLRNHNGVIRQALDVSGGREIKHTGDGIMACFPSAARALRCALAIQTRFGEESGAENAIRVRIGINAGEPVAEDGDLFGAAVQLAARIAAQAEGGQVLVSDLVKGLAMGKEFRFQDRGEATMKGFAEPVRVYEVQAEPLA